MTRATNPEYEEAYSEWVAHRWVCPECKSKNICDEGFVLRGNALRLVSSAWKYQ